MYFLATTAIERFWDKQKDILFLHEGCCRFSRRESLSKLNHTVMPDIWSENNKIWQCFIQVEKTYEKILDKMVYMLNDIHGVNYSKRYWRIFIGRWLHTYIFNVYDRYYSILQGLEIDPDLESIVLDKSCFIIPNDISEFYNYIDDDFYNLQIYSQILNHLGRNFQSKRLVYQNYFEKINEEHSILDNKKVARKKTDLLIMNKSYFSPIEQLLLINKCQVPIEAYFESQCKLPVFPINQTIRQKIHFHIEAENDIEQFIMNSISYNMPSVYIEGYDVVRNITYKHPIYSTMPKGILSATSFDSDEVFKQWAAECAEEGTQLIGVAHSTTMPLEQHAIDEHMQAICDWFYKPGFVFTKDGKNVKTASSPKFTGMREADNENNSSDILFITTNLSRNITQSFKFMIDFSGENYFKNQGIFWRTLSTDLKEKIKVRLYIKDYGMDCIERWKRVDSNIVLENWDIPLVSRMRNSKVIVCDNFQTTFSEAMVLNKPVILYWDYQKYSEFLHPKALACFEQMKDAGILHDNPVSAASLLNEIYSNIDVWWSNPLRQKVRKLVCEVFTGQSEEGIGEWVKELNWIFGCQEEVEKVSSVTEYFSALPENRIALVGVNEVSAYLISLIEKLEDKDIIGIIDNNEANFGKTLTGVGINSLVEIIGKKPDTIIIGSLQNAKQIEKQLVQYIPKRIKILNIVRDLPEDLVRELLIQIYRELN